MRKGKSSISPASPYLEMGEFWDEHDLGERWDETEGVELEVAPRSTCTYYPLDRELASKLRAIAERRGISAETLLNLWVQEKTREEANAT